MDGKIIIQLVLFLIQLYMAFSLNSFVSLDVFLPALFLYFISNLGAFIEKICSCSYKTHRAERCLSYGGVIICSVIVYGYIAESLHFIKFRYSNTGDYKIIVENIENTFLTFPSFNITPLLIVFVGIITAIHFLFFLIPHLRNLGYTLDLFIFTFKHRPLGTLICGIITLASSFWASYYCHHKSEVANSSYGSPQYWKYILLASVTTFCISFLILTAIEKNNKKKYLY